MSKYGTPLGMTATGEPFMISFSGFSPGYGSSNYLQEGDWAAGIITLGDNYPVPIGFIPTENSVAQRISVLFTNNDTVTFPPGASVRPFIALAITQDDSWVFQIQQDSIVYCEPFTGGIEYPLHTNRRGSLSGLNIPLPEGAMVAIVAGLVGENITEEYTNTFSANGGLHIAPQA